ncbi:MAG: MFS transporter [Beijerinckiaceae bacterium]
MSAQAEGDTKTANAEAQPLAARLLSPQVIIAAGCLVGIITFGPRSALGQFQLPILGDFKELDVATFSFAMALQYLFWGLGGPITGALADKYGTGKIMAIGCVVYCIALVLMVFSRDPVTFVLTQGVLFGLALSFASFNMIIGAFQKLLPPEWRSFAFGVGTAAGSFGQFLFSPLAGGMIQAIGWQNTAYLFAGIVLTAIPVALALSPPRGRKPAPGVRPLAAAAPVPEQTFREALKEAFSHKSYIFLVLGFFTCGFQLSFVTIHFQRFVVESGIRPEIGYWAFGMVGLFNIIGSMLSGWFSGMIPKRYVLSFIYFTRSMVTLLFIIVMPITPFSVFAFAILTGLLWLSTVPPTSGLIGVMFGSRYFSTLYGFAFLNHQIGGFLGLVLAGWLREWTGSFLIVWWLSIGFGIFSALINLPIVEKPVRSAQPLPA